jgi:hypothetical protein
VPAPTAAFQLEFLAKVERLLATGGFTATYKFALLIALANVAVERGDDSGREMRVDLGELSREFTRLYWNSAKPYPGTGRVLTHSRTKGNAAILGLLAPHVEAYGRPEEAMRRSPGETQQLIEKVRRQVLCRYPLYHLQLFEGTSTQEKLFDDFLYELPSPNEAVRVKQREIHLKPGVAACLRSLHGVIVSMCGAAWARSPARGIPVRPGPRGPVTAREAPPRDAGGPVLLLRRPSRDARVRRGRSLHPVVAVPLQQPVQPGAGEDLGEPGEVEPAAECKAS